MPSTSSSTRAMAGAPLILDYQKRSVAVANNRTHPSADSIASGHSEAAASLPRMNFLRVVVAFALRDKRSRTRVPRFGGEQGSPLSDGARGPLSLGRSAPTARRARGVKCTLIGPPVGPPWTSEAVRASLRTSENALDNPDNGSDYGRGALDYE